MIALRSRHALHSFLDIRADLYTRQVLCLVNPSQWVESDLFVPYTSIRMETTALHRLKGLKNEEVE